VPPWAARTPPRTPASPPRTPPQIAARAASLLRISRQRRCKSMGGRGPPLRREPQGAGGTGNASNDGQKCRPAAVQRTVTRCGSRPVVVWACSCCPLVLDAGPLVVVFSLSGSFALFRAFVVLALRSGFARFRYSRLYVPSLFVAHDLVSGSPRLPRPVAPGSSQLSGLALPDRCSCPAAVLLARCDPTLPLWPRPTFMPAEAHCSTSRSAFITALARHTPLLLAIPTERSTDARPPSTEA
jgi:hypothetical protein